MGDKNGGDLRLPLDAADLLSRLQAKTGVKVGEGLIQKENPRHLHQRTGNGDTLLLAAGELAGLALHQHLDLHQLRGLKRTFLHFLFGQLLTSPQVLQREENILPHGQVRIEGIVLKHQADTPVFRRKLGHIIVTEEYFPFCRRFKPADQVQGRTLPASRRAQKADQLSVGNLKIKMIDCDNYITFFLAAGEYFCEVLKNHFHLVFLPWSGYSDYNMHGKKRKEQNHKTT